jgi:glycosidase
VPLFQPGRRYGSIGSRRQNAKETLQTLAIVLFVFLLCAPLSAQSTPWWKAATGSAYQVLVYSFADSDGDGWGDLRGLTEHLDWLNDGDPATTSDLGVQAIWLSPINPANSYHGYDVTDYKGVSPRLGTLADFDALVAACHKRGIHVILDEVFNHSSSSHPWFQAALADPTGPYAKYYRFRKAGQAYGSGGLGRFYPAPVLNGGSYEYFSAFGSGMPDLDCGNTDVVNELKDVLRFWLSHGVDGFRFDAAKHVFDPNEIAPGDPSVQQNRAFWNDLRRSARRIKPDVLFLGEVLTENPTEIAAYAPAFDLLFDFPTAKRILALSSGSGGSAFIESYLRDAAQYSKAPGFTLAPLLSNHDQDRSMGLLLQRAGANATEGWGPQAGEQGAVTLAKRAALARARIAAAITMTLPGLPFIYYGEELGMTGRRYQNDDVARRDAFPWTPDRKDPPTVSWTRATKRVEAGQNRATPSALEQAGNPDSLVAAYRNLGALRALVPGIGGATASIPDWTGAGGSSVLSWILSAAGKRYLVVHVVGTMAFAPLAPPNAALTRIWSSIDLDEAQAIPPGESAVFAVDQ